LTIKLSRAALSLHAGNEQLAGFFAERFPPDVKKAYEAWFAQKPFENRAADAHPFVPNLYKVRGTAEAAAARADAERRVTAAREAGNRSGQYLANTVLFAGTAGKFEQPRVRLFAAAFGVALFVFAVVRMLLMPAA
jgi:sirohydrochlorin ferrochelatase